VFASILSIENCLERKSKDGADMGGKSMQMLPRHRIGKQKMQEDSGKNSVGSAVPKTDDMGLTGTKNLDCSD